MTDLTDEQIEAPSINEIRADYVRAHTRNFDAYMVGRSLTSEQELHGAHFDSAIARAKREERERAAADALDSMIDDFFKGDANRWSLPTSVIAWIRARPEYIARYGNQEAGQ